MHISNITFKFITALIMIFTLQSSLLMASETSNGTSFQNWVERLKNQALSQGISSETLDQTFQDISEISLDEPVSSNTNMQYLRYSLSNRQISFNKQMLSHYNDVLFEIRHLFGVNEEIIVALWGMDNRAVQSSNQYPAINVLANLSYLQPSNAHAKTELFQALKIIDEGQVSAQGLRSDSSGNLGSTYFKPTTFRDFAIDYDGDGSFDIWQNYLDIFASTANYLNSIGWKANEPWGIEVKLPAEFDEKLVGVNSQRTLRKWQELGVRLNDGSDLPSLKKMSSIIQTKTGVNKTFLVFDNYFALLRWKRSEQFALGVGLMADRIRKNGSNSISSFATISE